MTPPAPTPEEVRAHAEDALDWLDTLDPQVKKLVIDDVTALVLAERTTAHARGRAEGLEAAARVAERDYRITQAIRALGSKDTLPTPDPVRAERRRIILLARQWGTEATGALADYLEQETTP